MIRILQHRAESIRTEAGGQENNYIKYALKECGKRKEKQLREKVCIVCKNHVVILYVVEVSEKFKRVFSKHKIPVYFKPMATLRQRLVRIPKHL